FSRKYSATSRYPAARALALTSALLSCTPTGWAQQPVPLLPDRGPRSIQPEPLPPIAPGQPSPPDARPSEPPAGGGPNLPPAAAVPAGPQETREFCSQSVDYALAPRDGIPAQYREFIGIWSDASWTPQLCAALIVQNVRPDGTASIVFGIGPVSAPPRAAGGVIA